MENKKNLSLYVIILLLVIVIIGLLIYIAIQNNIPLTTTEPNTDSTSVNSSNKIENSAQNINSDDDATGTEIEFVRIFSVDAKLSYSDTTGNYGYIVVNQFQQDMPTVMKIENDLFEQLEEGNNYEFTFRGEVKNNNDYSKLYDIVNDFECVAVNETNKTGLEQRQDGVVSVKVEVNEKMNDE